MKRILMLLEREFPPDVRVEKEAFSLAEQGYEIHVLSFNFGKRPCYEVTSHGIHIHRFNIHPQLFRKASALMNTIPLYQLLWFKAIKREMRNTDFDAIHVHDLPLCGIALKFARKFNIPLIADMHENYPYLLMEMQEFRHPLIRAVMKMNRWLTNEVKWLNSAEMVIATCDEMKSRLANEGIDPQKIIVIENTVSYDQDLPDDPSPTPGFITMIYLGGITRNRGLEVVIEGFGMIRRKWENSRLWIVGDSRYRKTLQKQISASNHTGITFWGWKSRDEAKELIQRSDICLIPHVKSIHTDNTSPNKIFEYFNASKPVIASNCDYLVRVIKETGAGVFYQYDSPSDFVRAYEELLSKNPKDLGRAARDAVIKKYNWTLTSQRLIDAYHYLLHTNQGNGQS